MPAVVDSPSVAESVAVDDPSATVVVEPSTGAVDSAVEATVLVLVVESLTVPEPDVVVGVVNVDDVDEVVVDDDVVDGVVVDDDAVDDDVVDDVVVEEVVDDEVVELVVDVGEAEQSARRAASSTR